MIDLERHGPWALVAGASEGIGEHFARQLAAAGFDLVLVARREPVLSELAASIRSDAGVEIRTVALDLTAADASERVADATADIEVGLLVYNAGADSGPVAFCDRSMEDVMRQLSLNVVTPTQLCHHFGELMRGRGRGGIVLLGSMAGVAGSALVATYAATKAYDQVLAEGLWKELQGDGVDVLCLVAGATATPAHARTGARVDEDHMDPADVAAAGLAVLGEGPTHTASPELAAGFDFLRSLPRAQAVDIMSEGTRGVFGLDG